MLFALTHGRCRPGPGDVLAGRAHFDARLAGGAASLTLWEAARDEAGGLDFTRIGPPVRAGNGAGAALRERALAHAAPLYNTGDCWTFAYVVGRALDRPVSVFLAPGIGRPGEPDHLAVDLGGGLLLDARGVRDAAGIAEGLQPGSAPAGASLDAAAVPALFDRFHAEPGYAFATKLGDGWAESTRILFETFLEEAARAAIVAAEPVTGASPCA